MDTTRHWWQDIPLPDRYWLGIRRLERQHYGCGCADGKALAMGTELHYVHLLTQPGHYDPSLRGGLSAALSYRFGLRTGFVQQAMEVDEAIAVDGHGSLAGPPVTAEAHRTLMEMLGEPRDRPARDWRRWNADRWAARWLPTTPPAAGDTVGQGSA